jgi:hypothetical protein
VAEVRRLQSPLAMSDLTFSDYVAEMMRLHERQAYVEIACEIETHPELKHEFPPTFEQSLTKALNFILQN